MSETRLGDYLRHIRDAAARAIDFTDGLDEAGFIADDMVQSAVVNKITIIGEAAARIMDRYPEFVERHSEIPWQAMRGMRNRLMHGYFEIDLPTVWLTVKRDLPALVEQVSTLMDDA